MLPKTMRRRPLTVDALWYCLCPSFQPSSLHRAVAPFRIQQKVGRRCLNTGPTASGSSFKRLELPYTTRNTNNDTTTDTNDENDGHGRWSAPRSNRHHWQTPEPTLEERLEEQTSKSRTEIPRIASALREIFRSRHVLPTSQHYKALILANIDRKHGSSEHARELLREMEAEGITADSATLHAVLETLAVRPDYLLRQEIITALRARWLSLSPAGWHHLTAGLIRDGQLELALSRVELMDIQGIRVQQWLHSLLIYALCEAGEFDEVVRLVRRRGMKIGEISKKLWNYLLNEAIRTSHLNLANYVWKSMVDMSYAHVDVMRCCQVLALAAHHGDTQLAESAFRQIVVLGAELSQEDYEHLAQAYAKIEDFKSSFEILCRMHGEGLVVRAKSTRAVLASLQKAMPHPAQIWKTIVDLKQQKLDIPVRLAKMMIEYCDAASANDLVSNSEAVNVALDIYKDIFDVCSGDVDSHTFNLLFALCRRAKRPDASTFLAREMSALGVEPEPATFENLILVCFEAENYYSAYMYAVDLKKRGWKVHKALIKQIRRDCDVIYKDLPFPAMLDELLRELA